jgi:hypothetical protein
MVKVIAIIGTLLLAGCAAWPQNAEEFRQAVPGAFLAGVEELTVDRPLRDVGATWQRRAPECLNVRVRTVSQSTTSYQNIITAYKPSVIVNKDHAELHVQRDFERGVVKVGNMPDGGYYLVVADAFPDGNRTRLKIYGPTKGHDVLMRAIKAWASGESTGCPDMTQIG